MGNNQVSDDRPIDENGNSKTQSDNKGIPLWLQGIDDLDENETKPTKLSEEQASPWIREIDADYSEQDGEGEAELSEPAQPISAKADSEADGTPIDEGRDDAPFIEESGHSPVDEEDASDDIEDWEITEEIAVIELSEELDDVSIDTDFDETTLEEGFVDISEVGLSKTQNDQAEISGDEPLREGELPEWLQEMIAEAEIESEQPETETALMSEVEPFPNADISDSINSEEDLVSEIIAPDEEIPSFDFETHDSDFDLDYALAIAKEDTAPVVLPADEEITDMASGIDEAFPVEDNEIEIDEVTSEQADEIELSLVEEEVEENQAIDESTPLFKDMARTETMLDQNEDLKEILLDEVPLGTDADQLSWIEQQLDQGQIDEALPIIQDLVEKSSHLEKLEVWLKEYSEQQPGSNKVMELIGDIALKRGEPEAAIKAYAKSLRLLLNNQEGSHGLD
ncbi:MAG TPA: hypothetical protein PLA02_08200 [Brevefilum fermentans]|jgi:hypothetical protein|nr:hypothetical protein [Brevefilum fermentans]